MRTSRFALPAALLAGFVLGVLALHAWNVSRGNDWAAWTRYRRELQRLYVNKPSVVMLGDSLTERGQWTELTGCPWIANFGINGDTSAGVLARLDDVIALHPKAVLLTIGVNDKPGIDTRANIAMILARLRGAGIHAEQIELSDLVSADLLDGLHLNASGYSKWVRRIAPIVARYCQG